MRVYIVRHAKAEKAGREVPDQSRALSAKGHRQAAELGARLSDMLDPPRTVVASPLVRARETAEAIALATGAELRVDPRLAPGASVNDLRDVVHGAAEPVVTVGHQPDCSEMAIALTGGDPGFPTAGMLEIELDA